MRNTAEHTEARTELSVSPKAFLSILLVDIPTTSANVPHHFLVHIIYRDSDMVPDVSLVFCFLVHATFLSLNP